MKYPTIRATVVTVLVCLVVVSTLRGVHAEDLRRLAYQDPVEAGIDFLIQGEYTGTIVEPYGGPQYVGLQIVARGGGEFEALFFPGGLPGAGADTERSVSLAGALDGEAAYLEGEGRGIVADGFQATLYDSAGNELGQLEKTQRVSPTLGAPPPPGAIVLFDGQSTENLNNARVTEEGLLEMGPTTAMPVEDFYLHVEFRLPFMPYARGQGRGNSGIYIQRRYEVQILDSFGMEPLFDGSGSLYRQQAADVNGALPPLSWQTFDIWFRTPRWDDEDNKVENARITVLMNGIPIHVDREVIDKTGAGRPEGREPLPILFQDHRCPVRFQNLWIVMGEVPPPILAPAVPERARPRRPCFPILRRVIQRLRACRS